MLFLCDKIHTCNAIAKCKCFHCHKRYDRKIMRKSRLIHLFMRFIHFSLPTHTHTHICTPEWLSHLIRIIRRNKVNRPTCQHSTYEWSTAKKLFWMLMMTMMKWNSYKWIFCESIFRSYTYSNENFNHPHTPITHRELQWWAECARARFSFKSIMMPNHDHCMHKDILLAFIYKHSNWNAKINSDTWNATAA